MKSILDQSNEIEKSEDTIQRQYLTFQLGEELFGLDLIQAREIIKPTKATNIPNSADYIIGIINLRGQLVTVLDLKKRLNLEVEVDGDDKRRIIIINLMDNLLGLLVDSVEGVVEVSNEEIEKVSLGEQSIKDDYIKGVAKLNEGLLIIINIKDVLLGNNK